MPVDFGSLTAFTFCLAFTEPEKWEQLSTVMYYALSKNKCDGLALFLEKKQIYIDVFSNRYALTYHPSRKQTICMSWKNTDGRVDIYYQGVFQISRYVNILGSLLSPGRLSFGNYVKGDCAPKKNQSKYRGKILFFSMHERAFSDQELKVYGNRFLEDKLSVVVTWNQIGNKTFHHDGVVVIN